jgi:hypothetical protein
VPFAAAAVALVAFGRTLLFRAFLPAALAALGLYLLARALRWGAPRRPPKRRGLSLSHERLAFQGADASLSQQTLVTTSEPFGVTLLSTPRRDRALALLTSKAGTFCVGCSIDGDAARRALGPLLDSAFTITNDEIGLEAIGPDGEPLVLATPEFIAMIEALASADRGCLERLVLSDARGAPLVLDGRELRTGERAFDLAAPLEWRGIVFQEAIGQAIAVYQGTWIRQGGNEAVLVSLLPSIVSSGVHGVTGGSSLAGLDRSVLRDLRLMQAVPEEPPPVEQRVAIDRLFMLPVRFALDKAPRPSKHSLGRAQRQG